MLALKDISEIESEKTTKILKPWWNVFNDYLVIFLLSVPIFVGGMELASSKFVCLPAVDCSLPKNGTLLSGIKYHNAGSVFCNSTDAEGKARAIITKLKNLAEYDYVNSECSKSAVPWFHSYFPLFLFGQAFILFMINNLWLQFPSTASFVNSFYALAKECYNLPGAQFAKLAASRNNEHNAITELSEFRTTTESPEELLLNPSRSTYPFSCQAEPESSVGVDLSTAVAVKTLYEKIKRFTDYVKLSQRIQRLYLIQAVSQALLTITFFTLNIMLKDLQGTRKCSIDEYFPVEHDYFVCSHNLTAVFDTALVLFLIILGIRYIVCAIIVGWTIYKVFWVRKYYFENELNEWGRPSDLAPAEADMGFLLHLLHAYNELYAVQFAIYLSEKHHKKFKNIILDNEWPVENLERCINKDVNGEPLELFLTELSGIPNVLFRNMRKTVLKLKILDLSECGPLRDCDFVQFGLFVELCVLSIHSCGLTNIPEEVFKLTELRTLSLVNNSIKEVQAGISKLINLENFNIRCNKVKTIHSSIETLPLKSIDISNNPNISKPAIMSVLACARKDLFETLVVSGSSVIQSCLLGPEDVLNWERVAVIRDS